MGHVNFGVQIHDRKGLHGPVKLVAGGPVQELTGWQVFPLKLDAPMLAGLRWGDGEPGRDTNGVGRKEPAFWRGSFEVAKPADTFLDLRTWGKGVVWINGHCLGRFWNIGPTQTAYVPAPWLKAGRNEVIVLDLVGPRSPVLAGLDKPILDELHPELDFWGNR
jgi:beta-galactosidase